MIRTESLTKYFGWRCAVRDFTAEIADREIVGFLGLNGAGKTTALRMLAGLLMPSSGRVLIDGEDLAGPNGHRARARIGFLPDRPPVYEDMSVRRYLDFAARLRGYSGGSSRIDDVLERTALQNYADEPIEHLSHGYRQRLGIAQAIVHDPALVILDEPTSGLDPQQIVEMRALIQSLREDHTVLLSSHNLYEVNETCDQLILIHEGRLEAQGSPEELARRFGEGRELAFTLTGTRAKVESVLTDAKKRGEVASFTYGEPDGADIHRVSIEATAAPEAVAQRLVQGGLGIRRMQPVSGQLEGLFAELTRRAA